MAEDVVMADSSMTPSHYRADSACRTMSCMEVESNCMRIDCKRSVPEDVVRTRGCLGPTEETGAEPQSPLSMYAFSRQ